MSYMTKQDLEIIATFFNLVPTEDVIRAVGDWKVTGRAGKWCFGPTGGPVRNSPDPTIASETTNARGKGCSVLTGNANGLGQCSLVLETIFAARLKI